MNRIFHRRLSALHRASARSFSRVTATIAESVKGIRVTQGFSRQSVNAGIFRELVRDHFHKGRTSIVVAHRLSTIRHADRVLVLDQGEIVESGAHENLLGNRGYYARLYKKFVTF